MSGEAFDRMLARLSPQERERIREMAMAFGLTFDDPSWVPFAITQMTLDELKNQVDDAVDAMEKAADVALRRIGNSARVACKQAQTAIDAQAGATEKIRDTMLAIEGASGASYRTLLAELSTEHLGKLIEKGTRGIVRDVSLQLTGENGTLMRSAVDHAAALEASRQPFVAAIDAAVAKVDDAGRKAASATRRGVRYTVLLAMGIVVLYAAVMFGLMIFWFNRLPGPDSSTLGTCASAPRSTTWHGKR